MNLWSPFSRPMNEGLRIGSERQCFANTLHTARQSKANGACWTGHQPYSDPKVIAVPCAVWCGFHRPWRRTETVAGSQRWIRVLLSESRPYRELCPCLSEAPLPQSHPAQEPWTGAAVLRWQRGRVAGPEPAEYLLNGSQRQPSHLPSRDAQGWPDWVGESRSWLPTISASPGPHQITQGRGRSSGHFCAYPLHCALQGLDVSNIIAGWVAVTIMQLQASHC